MCITKISYIIGINTSFKFIVTYKLHSNLLGCRGPFETVRQYDPPSPDGRHPLIDYKFIVEYHFASLRK